jgi:PAS domain S-box-containing protein
MAEQNQRSLVEAERLAVDLSRESLRNAEFANKLVDTLGAVVAVLDRSGVVIRFNHTAERVTGFERDEVIGRPLWDKLVPVEQRDEVEKVFQNLVAGFFPNTHTNHWMTRSGEMRLIDWANTALLDDEGKVEFVIASGIDVTKQRANEEELKIAAVAFNTNEAIVVTDVKANILSANRIFTDITGYEADEVIGHNTSLLKSGRHDEAFYRDMWSQLNSRGFWIGEIWNKRKDGEIFQCGQG